MNRWITPALMAGLVGLLGYGLLTSDPNREHPSPLVGQVSPTFALKDLGGQTHDLAQYRGRPVVINFWASWCNPCRQESPLFERVSREQAGKVQFLGVIYNDQPALAQKFMDEYRLKYPALADPGSQAAIKYGIGKIPVTYVLDPQGKVVFFKMGPVVETELLAALRQAGAKL